MADRRARLLDALRRSAHRLNGLDDVGVIVDHIGDASTVLLGEATHGTHEFYAMRAALTRWLIEEKGFDAVAVEADWPDALRAHRFVVGDPAGGDADEALGGFERFPRWMWRNRDVRAFIGWLRQHNDAIGSANAKTGFYGLDLYSLRSSMQEVIRYLENHRPELVRHARERYACFNGLAADPQRYGHAVNYGLVDDCEHEVVQQLQELLQRSTEPRQSDGHGSADELFYARQNARVVHGAEQYYRIMYRGGSASWNLRDTHMADTLDALREHLSAQRGRPAKIVVWAHNSHVGDARATDMGEERGEINLGQLARTRARVAGSTFLLGFTTHTGRVAAASDWDEPVEHKRVLPSREDSVERLLHDAGMATAFFPLRGALEAHFDEHVLLERAIGVIYRPDTERWSHYFRANLARQFDAVVHVDRTSAVAPLDDSTHWQHSAEEETYPFGL